MRDDESTRDHDPAAVGELGDRPAADPRGRDVARANIGAALFRTTARVEVGRYHLLQRVGAGGMGVVWGAWDPELERRVAIKLVKVASSATRTQILSEGQALAKLSHPHVVPVYDVGTIDDEIYLVMEWVAGVTLRAWAASRPTRAVVGAYRAAGEGLVAAHAAGIVHRDFKPENVIVGDDGRVRVLDFGLARAESTGDGRVAGTPRYMAPEQAAGAAATPAADQYSFCVSLQETLDRDLPSWLAAIVVRGTATDPAARFPNMAAVLAALAREPARIWRRRAAVAGAVLLAGSAFAVGTLRGHGVEPCAADTDELAGVWSPTISARLADHARTLGPYGVIEAPTLTDHLGRYTERWVAARKSACVAHQRDELPPQLYTRTLACLERSRGALDATVGAASRATLEHFAEAVLAVEALPDAEHCALAATTDDVAAPSLAQLAVVAALGADAAKAQYLALASDPAALPLARSVVSSATALGYRPLEARARLALGEALHYGSEAAARDELEVAAKTALAAGDDITFVEAFARQLYFAGRTSTSGPLLGALPLVAAIAIKIGSPGRFARTLLYNNAGTERLASGDATAARTWFEKARAEPVPDERGIELWAVSGNLAMVTTDPQQRDALFAEEGMRLERMLGAAHAFTLQERLRAAMFIDDPVVAMNRLDSICAAYASYQPAATDRIGACNYELGWLALARGHTREARRAFAIVVSGGREHAAVAATAVSFLDGDLVRAARDANALAKSAAAETVWWKRFAAVDAQIIGAQAMRALDRRAEASAALTSAEQVLALPGANSSAAYFKRRLTRIRELKAE